MLLATFSLDGSRLLYIVHLHLNLPPICLLPPLNIHGTSARTAVRFTTVAGTLRTGDLVVTMGRLQSGWRLTHQAFTFIGVSGFLSSAESALLISSVVVGTLLVPMCMCGPMCRCPPASSKAYFSPSYKVKSRGGKLVVSIVAWVASCIQTVAGKTSVAFSSQ